jgi:hypothetical protein
MIGNLVVRVATHYGAEPGDLYAATCVAPGAGSYPNLP